MDSGLLAAPVIGPRFARTRWLGPDDGERNAYAAFGTVLRFLTGPRIEKRNPDRLEVRDITRDDGQTVHHRGCGDQGVAFASPIWNMKTRAALCHGGIDREDTALKTRQNLVVDPGAQDFALRRILSLDPQHA
jgi:hypothetical protein